MEIALIAFGIIILLCAAAAVEIENRHLRKKVKEQQHYIERLKHESRSLQKVIYDTQYTEKFKENLEKL